MTDLPPLSHVFVCLSKAGRGARSLHAIISFQQSVLKCYHHPSSLFLPFFQMLKQNPRTELKCTRSSQKYRSADVMSASRVFILIFVPLQQLLVTSHKPSFLRPLPSLVSLIWVFEPQEHLTLTLTPLWLLFLPVVPTPASRAAPPLPLLPSHLSLPSFPIPSPPPRHLPYKHTSNQYRPYQRRRRCRAHRTQRRQEGRRRLSLRALSLFISTSCISDFSPTLFLLPHRQPNPSQ